MIQQHINNMKVVGMNIASWVGTIFSLQHAIQAMQLIGLMGSFAVSVFSIWWIMKQAKAADESKKHPRHED